EQRGGSRVGAEETRGGRADHAVDDEVVERDVVPAESPAPRPRAARGAEHPQVVQAGVAAALAAPVDRPALGPVEDVVQAQDGGGGDVPSLGEPAGDQLYGLLLLGRALGV